MDSRGTRDEIGLTEEIMSVAQSLGSTFGQWGGSSVATGSGGTRFAKNHVDDLPTISDDIPGSDSNLSELVASELSAIQDAIAASYSRVLTHATTSRKSLSENKSVFLHDRLKGKGIAGHGQRAPPAPLFPLVPSDDAPRMELPGRVSVPFSTISSLATVPPHKEVDHASRTANLQPTPEHHQPKRSQVELLDAWTSERSAPQDGHNAFKKMEFENKVLIRQATHGDMLKVTSDNSDVYGGTEEPVPVRTSTFVIHPHSTLRGTWDMMSLALVLYDMIYLPLGVFDPEPVTFTIFMAWYSRIFWTVDLPVTFMTGFLSIDGVVIMDMRYIAYRYLKTFFCMDIFLVAIDWAELMWSDGSSLGLARIGKASRTFRIMRMLRLLRLIRMREVLKVFFERIRSEQFIILFGICQIVVMIVGLAHFVACIWYGIGTTGDADNRATWVRMANLEVEALEYRYATSLHWSLSQFSGGMDEVRPFNIEERVYAVVVFIVGFMVAAMTVSELTSSLTRLHIIASHQSRHLAVLRRYLAHNGISDNLALRVQRNAFHVMSEQQRMIPEEKVELLSIISKPLRVDLHFEMHAPVLEVHPFFEIYSELCPQVMRQICHEATSNLLVSQGDVVFCAGETPKRPKMYFVCSGNLSYIPMSGKVANIKEAQWLSETSLWARWMHRGVLQATADCRLLLLDAQTFQDIVSQFDVPDLDVKKYAEAYVRRLNQLEAEQLGPPSDLPNGQEPRAVTLARMGRVQTGSHIDAPSAVRARMTILRTTFRRASVLVNGATRGKAKGSFLVRPRESLM